MAVRSLITSCSTDSLNGADRPVIVIEAKKVGTGLEIWARN